MADLVLGPLLRFVGESAATVFVETDAPCRVSILARETRTFTVAGHHYALVIIDGLMPGSTIPYDVRLDGTRRWPLPGSRFPNCVIRTLGGEDRPTRVLFGSCRSAAPHEPPWSLSATEDRRGLGVDSLRAHGLRMLGQDSSSWPDLLLLIGDQVYADEPSPHAKEKVKRRRRLGRSRLDRTSPEIVVGFDEYASMYHEAWTPEVERWLFSVVPTAMIFDDHDMIDDWNISMAWVRHIQDQPWWDEHVTGALSSYWIYQHLGNLSPGSIARDGLLERLLAEDDGASLLNDWARRSECFTPIEGRYRFSYVRDLQRTRIVVVDCRNARVLDGERAMVNPSDWTWVDEQCRADVDHLFIVTSLPVLVTGGLHGLQLWNAALCDGRWGRAIAWLSERLRRALDLEDWPAFEPSFLKMAELLRDIAMGIGAPPGRKPPAVVAVLSGDIHFSYVAEVAFTQPGAISRVYQLVCSPIRQALPRHERKVILAALSRPGRVIGGFLQRSVRAATSPISWELTHGPAFANDMAVITIDGPSVNLLIEQALPDDEGQPVLSDIIRTPL